MKNISLLLTEKCNLKCNYCFQQAKEYKLEKNLIDIKNIIKLIDKDTNLHFFGGECFLEEGFIINLDKEINKLFYGNSITKKPNYIFSTNLFYLSNKIKKFLLEKNTEKLNKIKLVISVDGGEYIHDKNRLTIDGKKTFNKIIENKKFLVNNNIEISTVVSVYNIEHINNGLSILNTIAELYKLFPEAKFFKLNYCNNNKLSLDRYEFLKLEINAVEAIFKKIISFDHTVKQYKQYFNVFILTFFSNILKNDTVNQKCSNYYNRISIMPNGKIYNCIDEHYLLNRHINFNKDEKCKNCKYSTICQFCPLLDIDIKKECYYKLKLFKIFEYYISIISCSYEYTLFFKETFNISSRILKELFIFFRNKKEDKTNV